METSWREQRAYVELAEKQLGVTPDYPVCPPELSEYSPMELSRELPYEISWQLFDNSDYARYKRDYMRCFHEWAIWDFTKVGLEDYTGGIFTPKVSAAYRKDGEELYLLTFDEALKQTYGLPDFYLSVCGEVLTVKWFGKLPSRLPQAFWLKLKGFDEDWEINKMGLWLSPDDIIGSPFITGMDRGIRNSDTEIESLDCALVAPYGRRLLQFGKRPEGKDLYFNLYNNIWNTNFPMWYSDDGLFRFLIKKR